MKKHLACLPFLLILACNQPADQPEEILIEEEPIDIKSELAALEKVRTGFTTAIDEKRYDDLGQFAHPDIQSIGPGSEEWAEYRKFREEQTGLFSYDSIRMHPYETMLLNDTIAYDYGWSSVYYTNPQGQPVEITDTYLVLMKKGSDGQWKLWREVASGRVDDR